MKEYILTLRIRFEALDDIEARKKAQKELEHIGAESGDEIKLQEVSENKPPRKVKFKT